jgi:hypothetical protein
LFAIRFVALVGGAASAENNAIEAAVGARFHGRLGSADGFEVFGKN